MTQRTIAQHLEAGTPAAGEIVITELRSGMVEVRVRDKCASVFKTASLILHQDDWDEFRQAVIANG